jgi:predicted outer membrane protein
MLSFIRRFRSIAALGASAWLVSAAVVAQEAKTQRQPDRPDPSSRPVPTERAPTQAASSNDALLASCLIIDNQGEIALAQLAQQRAQNPAVKAFAQQLVQDHTEAIKKLQQFAGSTHLGTGQPGQAGQAPSERGEAASQREAPETRRDPTVRPANPAAPANPGTPRTTTSEPQGTARQAQPQTQPGGREIPRDVSVTAIRPSGEGLDFIAIKRELGQKCLQSARRELEGKSGAEFDKCYVHMAVWGHMRAIDTMEVFQSRVSPPLRQVLAEGIQMSQGHLKTAQDLAKKLDGGEEGRTSQTSTTKANRE